MAWEKVAELVLGSGPLAACLALGLWILWRDNQATRAALTKSQDDRISDLKSLMKSDD